MTKPARLSGLAAARKQFGDKAERFAAFFLQGDPLADAAVAALSTMPRSTATALLHDALENGIDAAQDAPVALVELFHQLEHVPVWVDWDRCSRGGESVLRSGVFGGLALFGSLARSYCSAGGSKPLIFTGALLERTFQRLGETAHFVWIVSQSDALKPRGAGYSAVVHVRLAHARVRRACARSPEWHEEKWGLPINQADMAATVLLFSRGLAERVRRLGGLLAETEEADLLHLWRYAGYLLGVNEELLCASPAESAVLAELIDVIDAGPDEDSRRLIAALFDPKPYREKFANQRVGDAVRATYQAICRSLLGNAKADAVALSGQKLSALIRTSRPWIRAAGTLSAGFPFSQEIRLAIGRSYWQHLAAGAAR